MDEKRGFISIRKKMMVVFVVLITVTELGLQVCLLLSSVMAIVLSLKFI